MKILDLYIIRKFLGTFFFMIGAFMVIAVVFDISENVDDLIKSQASFGEIVVDYYLNFCFYFANLLSSFIIFLTIIWFTSQLAQRSEIVAVLSGGVSFRRFIQPYFIAASILVAMSLLLSHYIVPHANRGKYDFEITYLKGALTLGDKNLHREISPGTIAYFRDMNLEKNIGYHFSLERWENNALTWKLVSQSAVWHPDSGMWTINRPQIREFLPDGTERLRIQEKLDTIIDLTPEDFAPRSEIVAAMTWNELNEFAEEQRRNGSGRIAFIEIEKYSRTSNAFSIFVLTLIGVSISARKTRGGTGVHLLIAVVVGFLFVFISRITTVAATNVGFPASLAVWVPNFLFIFVGLYFYRKAQK
ncbi:MAG: hypothetical protein RL220_1226 [Bacteroidota bacterium]|jgi:lipopolysaccharide export system permease protein